MALTYQEWLAFVHPQITYMVSTYAIKCGRWLSLSSLTCSHHFINGDAGSFQFLGKLVHSLTRVLIRMGVHVGSDTRETHCSGREQVALINDH